MSPILAVRAIVVISLGLLMLLGPGYRQVLGRKSDYLRPWVMYSGVGKDQCDVRFWKVDADGQQQPLDRFRVLYGDQPWWDAPSSVRHPQRDDLENLAARMCRRVDGDVRVTGRCGSRRSWKALEPLQVSCGRRGARPQRDDP